MADDQAVVETKEIPLADWKKSRNEGVTPAVEEPAKEEPKPEPEEQEQEKTEEKAEDKPKQKGWNGAQKKIDRLVKHNAELEKRAEQAEREREELRAKGGKAEEKTKAADDEPKIEDFATTEEFYRAQGRWAVRQEIKEQKEAELRAQEDAYAKEIFDQHNLTISEARAKYEDFDEAVNATATPWKDGSRADVAASQAFHVAVVESGIGAELLYHYAKHPEELNKLGGLTPAKVQMAIGRLTDKLEAKLAKKSEPEEEEEEQEQAEEEEKPEKKKLPTPITPVGRGTSTASKELKDLPLSEYKKARNAGRVR